MFSSKTAPATSSHAATNKATLTSRKLQAIDAATISASSVDIPPITMQRLDLLKKFRIPKVSEASETTTATTNSNQPVANSTQLTVGGSQQVYSSNQANSAQISRDQNFASGTTASTSYGDRDRETKFSTASSRKRDSFSPNKDTYSPSHSHIGGNRTPAFKPQHQNRTNSAISSVGNRYPADSDRYVSFLFDFCHKWNYSVITVGEDEIYEFGL